MFSDAGDFGGSTSPVLTQTVNLASTTTTVTGSVPDPSVVGQDYVVSVSVAPVAPGAGVPSGTVHVSDSDGNGCDVTLSGGSGSCTLPSDSAGTKTLDAHYQGDASFDVSDATSASHAVTSVTTSTSVISSVNPSVFGESVTFTATVSADAPSTATPVGSVEFFDGVSSLGAPAAVDGSGQVQLSTSALAVGSHDITAVFSDGGDFGGSTSPVVTQTVNQASTTTTVTGSTPDPSVVGQDYSVAVSVAAVAPGTGVPSGTVTVTDSDGNTCTVTLDGSGTGSCTLPSDSAGIEDARRPLQRRRRASTPRTRSPATHEVDAAATTTVAVSGTNPSVFGQSVTFTATVSADAPSTATPVGSVEFFDGVTSLGAPGAVDGSGQAQLSTSALAVGSHDITAVFSDAGDFGGSTSPVLTQTVNLASTTTTVTGSVPDPSVVGQDYVVSVSVAPVAPGAGVPSGTVHVSDSDGNGCDVTLSGGSGSCTLPSDSAGTKTLDAHYQGDASFDVSDATSASHAVTSVTTSTSVISSVNPSVFGESVTFTATVSADAPSTATPVGSVEFFDGVSSLGAPAAVDGSGQVQLSTSALAVGSHDITAVFSDGGDFGGSTSPVVTQTVNQASTTTTVTGSTPDPSVVGQDYSVAVSVAAVAPGTGVPTGTVHVSDSDGNGCDVTLSGGSGSCTLPSDSAGTKTLDAHYQGDASFDTSDAAPASHEVDAAATTTVAVSGTNPSVFGQSVTFTATVSADAPSTATPAGSVEFFDGVTSLGSDAVDGSGQAQLSTSALAVGSHDITAVFTDSGDFSGSTSPVLTQTVNLASTTTTVTGSVPDPSVVGQDYSVAVGVAAVAPGAGVPSGTVTVTDSDGNTCTVTLDIAGNGACDLPSDSAGTKTLDAHYQGDASFDVSDATSASHAVTSVTTSTSVISSVNPSVFGESVTFTATVSADAPSTATPVGSVEFFDGVSSLGAPAAVDGSGQVQLSTSALAVGSHDITAVFSDGGDFGGSTSPVVTQTVNQASTTTTVTGSTPDPSVVGQDYSVAVSVAAVAPGTGVPSGTVTVTDSDGNTCTVTLDGSGTGSCTLPSDSAGTKTLDAHYQGDASFDTSDAAPATHEVDAAATTTVAASGTNPSVFGQSVTFTATVSADAPSTATPAGSVEFFDGVTSLGVRWRSMVRARPSCRRPPWPSVPTTSRRSSRTAVTSAVRRRRC